jgi:hypothetical protein
MPNNGKTGHPFLAYRIAALPIFPSFLVTTRTIITTVCRTQRVQKPSSNEEEIFYMAPRVTVPRWAEQITVQRQKETLIVKGIRRHPDQVVLISDRAARKDLLQPLPLEILEDGKPVERETVKPHLLFSWAVHPDSMASFVKTFGPVWGQVEEVRPQSDGTDKIIVRQSLRTLKQLQRQVMIATDMVAKVKNVDTLNADDWELLASETMSLNTAGPKGATVQARFRKSFEYRLSKTGPVLASPLRKGGVSTAGLDMVRLLANWELCSLLNKYPPVVSFFDQYHVRELPINSAEGILPTLYFLLRQDYLAEGRSIRNCASCGRLFTATRKNLRCCSPNCSHRNRNRKYWCEKGNQKRKERLEVAQSPQALR